jgi:hypothetical protein
LFVEALQLLVADAGFAVQFEAAEIPGASRKQTDRR